MREREILVFAVSLMMHMSWKGIAEKASTCFVRHSGNEAMRIRMILSVMEEVDGVPVLMAGMLEWSLFGGREDALLLQSNKSVSWVSRARYYYYYGDGDSDFGVDGGSRYAD